jgi:hypothetical protein
LLIPVQIDLAKPMLEEAEEELLVDDEESVCRDARHAHEERKNENMMAITEAKSDTSKVSKQLRQLEKDHFNELMHDTS